MIGSVYVVGNVGVGTVKVGYTDDVPRRMAELVTGYTPRGVDPSALVALRIYGHPMARRLELAMHARFAAARLPREGMAVVDVRPGGEGWTEWFDLGRDALTRTDWAVRRFVELVGSSG